MIPKEKIDSLILSYFIQEGFQEAAVSFAKEMNVDIATASPAYDSTTIHHLNEVEDEKFGNEILTYFRHQEPVQVSPHTKLIAGYSTIVQRKDIKRLILQGHITEAIRKISEYFPSILDCNNLLHFKLLRLNLIEMIRNHKQFHEENNRQFLNNILTFVRENLISKVSNSLKLLKELETTMSLLCFNFDPAMKIDDHTDLPLELRGLFDLSLRNQCYRLVNKAILQLKDSNVYKGPDYNEFNLMELPDNVDLDMEDLQSDYLYDESTDEPEKLTNDEDNTEELNKLQSLALESKLERVVKLWALTEQRMVDLNIIQEKRFNLNDEDM
jgi:hypothetical protein